MIIPKTYDPLWEIILALITDFGAKFIRMRRLSEREILSICEDYQNDMVRTLLIARTMPARKASNFYASWTQANIVPTIPDQNQGLLRGIEFANSRKRANRQQGKNRASWKYTVQNHRPLKSI